MSLVTVESEDGSSIAPEIAATVCFLASEQAAYITGAVVPVDGGILNGLF